MAELGCDLFEDIGLTFYQYPFKQAWPDSRLFLVGFEGLAAGTTVGGSGVARPRVIKTRDGSGVDGEI